MRRILLWLCFFPLLLFAEWEEFFSNKEDPALVHHVSVITGNLNLSFQDIQTKGPKPISVNRTYSSAGALERSRKNSDLLLKSFRGSWLIQGGWNLLPHVDLLLEAHFERKEWKAWLAVQ